MKKETLFKIEILKQLKKIPYSYWIKIQQQSIHGSPDIIGSIGGKAVFLELKSSNTAPVSALQKFNLVMAANTGAICYIVTPTNHEKILKKLQKIGEKYENQIFKSK